MSYNESDIRKDMNDMCNLSQGIKKQAYAEGIENGIAKTIIKMHRKGYEAEQISDILDMEIKEVREIIENE